MINFFSNSKEKQQKCTLKSYNNFIKIICSHDSCGMLGHTEYDSEFLLHMSKFFHILQYVILAVWEQCAIIMYFM